MVITCVLLTNLLLLCSNFSYFYEIAHTDGITIGILRGDLFILIGEIDY